jgi:hypothetical protein
MPNLEDAAGCRYRSYCSLDSRNSNATLIEGNNFDFQKRKAAESNAMTSYAIHWEYLDKEVRQEVRQAEVRQRALTGLKRLAREVWPPRTRPMAPFCTRETTVES